MRGVSWTVAPTAEDRASLDAWFEQYDALSVENDVEQVIQGGWGDNL